MKRKNAKLTVVKTMLLLVKCREVGGPNKEYLPRGSGMVVRASEVKAKYFPSGPTKFSHQAFIL